MNFLNPLGPVSPFSTGMPVQGGVSMTPGAASNRVSSCWGCNQASAMEPMMAMQMQFNGMMMELLSMLLVLMMGRGGAGAGLLGGAGQGLAGAGGGGGATGATGAGGAGGAGATGGTGADVPTGAAGPKVQRFMDIAKAQTGDPYVFGAEGPNAFDCSGLVAYALNQAGVKVPRLTAAGYQDLYRNSRVTRDQLKPGDLIFYWSPNSRGIPRGQASHIEIYLGNGMAMGTDNPSEGARVEPVNWDTFIGGARVPALYQ